MSGVGIVVIGASRGGMQALGTLLPGLPGSFPAPVVVVQHRSADSDDFLARWLDSRCALRVVEAEHAQPLEPGRVYLAPADHHLLFEDVRTLALTLEERVHYSRPSVDVLFESAALVFGAEAVGVVLTGSNADGAWGAARIKQLGGRVIIQEPSECEAPEMPLAALAATEPDELLPLARIAARLEGWAQGAP